MIDYRIETFLVLCDCMNYRQAAKRLNITQPAVTGQIRHLEEEYGCRLFTYENRKLEKTEAGRILEQYGRAVRVQDHSLRAKLKQDRKEKTLRIGATKTIGDYVLTDQVKKYLTEEDHNLTFIVENTDHLLKELEDNSLDFAVVEGFFDKNKYDSILLQHEPFVGICSVDHHFAGRRVTLKELFNETIIVREEGSGTRAILEQELLEHNNSLNQFHRKITISNFPLILSLVGSGYGISFVYQVLAKTDPGLAVFRLEGEDIMREFNIVYLKNTDPGEKIRWFFGDI